jgi:hypothetical protein
MGAELSACGAGVLLGHGAAVRAIRADGGIDPVEAGPDRRQEIGRAAGSR